MPSVTSSVANFVTSIFGIFASLFNSVLAVFEGAFALGWDVVNSVFTIVQHVVLMVLDMFQGVVGFVAANFIAISVIGVAYYLYTNYTAQNKRGTRRKGVLQQ